MQIVLGQSAVILELPPVTHQNLPTRMNLDSGANESFEVADGVAGQRVHKDDFALHPDGNWDQQ